MALVFCDGFDSYAATADMAKKWGTNNGWVYNATAGRSGGGAMQATSVVTIFTPLTIISSTQQSVFGWWMKVSAIPAATTPIAWPVDVNGSPPASSNNQLQVITGSGLLRVSLNGGTFLNGNVNVCDGLWHWIEWNTECRTGGLATQILYVDSLIQFSTGGVNTSIMTQGGFEFSGLAGCTLTIDDFIAYNDFAGGGPVVSSFPLNPRNITTFRPDADNTQAFSRSAGAANYSLVNEQTQDGDTTYVECGTSGDQDLYEYAAYSTNPANITSIMLNNVVDNPNAGTINFQAACKSGATTTLGTSIVAPSSYFTKQQQYPVDPNTAAAWTGANLASAKFGIKVA